MWDIFSFDFWQTLAAQHSLWLMFVAAFLSATVLPGNSEVVFIALVTPKVIGGSFWNDDLLELLMMAAVGNTLGSLTTYWLGRLLPAPSLNTEKRSFAWAIEKLQRFGIWMLLLSWLPVVGDALCAMAGWLRLNGLYAGILIFLGKALRYIVLLLITFPFL